MSAALDTDIPLDDSLSDASPISPIDPAFDSIENVLGKVEQTEDSALGSEPGSADVRASAEPEGGGAKKKRQKRNKPTLSCEECVERKTKCDRGRPTCLACVKRQSQCRYSEIANLIAAADRDSARGKDKTKNKSRNSLGGPANVTLPPEILTPRPNYRAASISSSGSSPFLLSNIPNTKNAPSQIFGFSAEHPFQNYWTSKGGLPEVISVLPNKEQADFLVGKYFEAVDPVYPLINRGSFFNDYENFWAQPLDEKYNSDPVLLSLHLVIYAMGLQFVQNPSEYERAQMAEFYVSAAHQCLRISSYLSRVSLRTIQAMVLHCYFLMNDNHASDAWSFGGVLMRQAYAMGLNRDPEIIVPRSSPAEKTQRRKVWQAVMFQDTFLTILLKLPPTGTFSDINVESLTNELDDGQAGPGLSNGDTEMVINPMSISSIAPDPNAYPPWELDDREYIRCTWSLANLVQRTICIPRSLNRPLCHSASERRNLCREFQELYATYPPVLTMQDRAAVEQLARTNPRSFRQNVFSRSNYWHCYMIIQSDASEHAVPGVTLDVRAALEAARTAIESFFQMWEYLRVDAGVWWVFQHRAFEEALTMARILSLQTDLTAASDSLFALAKMDIRKMLDILEQVGVGAPEMQKTRSEVLRAACVEVNW